MGNVQSNLLVFVFACAITLLPASDLFAEDAGRANAVSHSDKNLLLEIDKELAQIETIYEVYYEQASMARKLKATYHHALLAQNVPEKMLVFQLPGAMHDEFTAAGLSLQPAIEYRTNRRDQLQDIKRQLESKLYARPSASDSNSISFFRAESAASIEPGIPGFSCYPTVEETFIELARLRNGYPMLAELIDIGDSWEKTQDASAGYDLWVMKITNQSISGDKPILFVQSAMHAREYATAALTLDFARLLLDGYQSDPDIEWIVDFHEVHLLIHMNPDGRKIAESGLLKRKNTNSMHCSENTVSRGVDLNRNFSFFRGAGEDASTDNFVVSDEPCSQVYRGPYAASEPETQAVENYARTIFPDLRGINENDPADEARSGLYLDIHSFGNLILYPYSHTADASPNDAAMRRLARRLAYFNNYIPAQGPELYLLNGSSESIAYGELGVAHLTFELGNTFFENCITYENTIKPNNLLSLLHAAKIAAAPFRLPSGPYVDQFFIKGRANPDITQGSAFTVTATVSDMIYSNLSGVEPSDTISSVEMSFDEHFYNPSLESIVNSMAQADDGLFDESVEKISFSVSDSQSRSLELGQHTVYLRGLDSAGNYGATVARSFTVIDCNYLEASMTIDCGVNNVCLFSGLSSLDTDGEIQSFSWSISDGSVFSGSEIRHYFEENGVYEVMLEVVAEDGEVASATAMLEIDMRGTPPIVSFSIECNGLRCKFDGSQTMLSNEGIDLIRWDLGDETRIKEAFFEHDYASTGSYQVDLLVRNSDGWRTLESFDVSVALNSSFVLQRPVEGHLQRPTKNGGGATGVMAISFFFLAALVKTVLRFRLFVSVCLRRWHLNWLQV